ncbi:MAG TPA: LptF/LptG family permease [Lacipirellulaceae bacterium]
MRILSRYVLMDLLKVFLLTLTGLTAIIFVFLMGKEAVDKNFGLGPLLRVAPYLLPQAMQFAVPGTMLLATTSVYGRIASYNEFVAIKSLGISPMVLVWPTLIVATLMSFIGVVLNDIAVSWGRLGAARVALECIEEIAYRQLEMRHSFNMGKFNMTVRDVEGRRLIWPTLIIQSSGRGRATTVSADEAELRLLLDENILLVRFRNVEAELRNATATLPEEIEYPVPLDELSGATAKTRSPSNYALAEIREAVAEQEELVARINQSMTAQAALGLLSGDFEALSQPAWKPHEQQLQAANVRLHRLHTEPWRRWANGFSCLCFVIVGVPVAVWMRFSEFIASFFICFLPILVVYYPLLAVSVDQAKDGVFPPQSVWLGNVLLALAGIWLLRRVNRY